MLEEIVNLVHAISNILYYFIVLSYNLGKGLFYLIVCLEKILTSIINQIGTFLVVFYEDYCIFHNDVELSMSGISSSVSDTTKTGITATWNFLNAVFDTFIEVFTTGQVKFYRFSNVTSQIFLNSTAYFKQFFILLGNAMWFVLTLIPNMLTYVVSEMGHVLMLAMVYWWNLMLYLFQGVCFVAINILDYFKDVPIQSAIGIVCFYLLWRNYNVIAPIIRFLKLAIGRYARELKTRIVAYSQRQLTIFMFEIRNSFPIRWRSFRRPAPIPSIRTPPQRQNVRRITPSPRPPLSPQKDGQLCIVCHDREKCVLLFPCKHLCLCNECANIIDGYENKCPICRVQIYQKIKVYV